MASANYLRLAKEGSWVFGGQIAAVLGALALVRVLTERLTPEEYGQLALGLTVAGLVNQVVMGGITVACGRFYSIAHERGDLQPYLRACGRLMGYATVVVAGIALVLISGLAALDQARWIPLSAAAVALAVFAGYSTALSSIQNAARQRPVAAIHTGFDAWMKIGLALLAMLWLGQSSLAVVLGFLLSSVLTASSQLVFLRRSLLLQSRDATPRYAWLRQMWGYSWPFSIWGAFSWVQQASDRWALQVFGSTEEVGLYVVVFQLGFVPIGLATGAIITFLGPILYQRSGSATDPDRNDSVHRLAWRTTQVGLATTLLGFLAALLLHSWVFDLLVAPRYHSASPLLPWMVLAGGVFAAGQMLALKLLSEMKSAAMTVAKVVTSGIGVCLNIYGASRFGITGLVAALVAFSLLYFMWMAWIARRPPKTS